MKNRQFKRDTFSTRKDVKSLLLFLLFLCSLLVEYAAPIQIAGQRIYPHVRSRRISFPWCSACAVSGPRLAENDGDSICDWSRDVVPVIEPDAKCVALIRAKEISSSLSQRPATRCLLTAPSFTDHRGMVGCPSSGRQEILASPLNMMNRRHRLSIIVPIERRENHILLNVRQTCFAGILNVKISHWLLAPRLVSRQTILMRATDFDLLSMVCYSFALFVSMSINRRIAGIRDTPPLVIS